MSAFGSTALMLHSGLKEVQTGKVVEAVVRADSKYSTVHQLFSFIEAISPEVRDIDLVNSLGLSVTRCT
jgi:hypothetical protein